MAKVYVPHFLGKIGLLADAGVNLPPDVQSQLHGSLPSQQHHEHEHRRYSAKDHDKDGYHEEEEDEDDGDDPYMGDWHDGMPPMKTLDLPTGEHDGFNDQHVEDPSKRARTSTSTGSTNPAAKDQLGWSHASPRPLQHLIWGRVRGDGNCLWRSLSELTRIPWEVESHDGTQHT